MKYREREEDVGLGGLLFLGLVVLVTLWLVFCVGAAFVGD